MRHDTVTFPANKYLRIVPSEGAGSFAHEFSISEPRFLFGWKRIQPDDFFGTRHHNIDIFPRRKPFELQFWAWGIAWSEGDNFVADSRISKFQTYAYPSVGISYLVGGIEYFDRAGKGSASFTLTVSDKHISDIEASTKGLLPEIDGKKLEDWLRRIHDPT